MHSGPYGKSCVTLFIDNLCIRPITTICIFCMYNLINSSLIIHPQFIGRRMLRMELPGKRKRGKPKSRFMNVVKGIERNPTFSLVTLGHWSRPIAGFSAI